MWSVERNGRAERRELLTQAAKHVQQVRIVETVKLEQLTQVLNSRRNGVDEVLLTFEIAAETIGTQNLQRTEKYKERQAVDKMTMGRHFDILA